MHALLEKFTLQERPRRNRRTSSIRKLISETSLSARDFVYPLFVLEGRGLSVPIASMPGIYRQSLDNLLKDIERSIRLGICAFSLFPVIERQLKDETGTEALNRQGILQKAIRVIKNEFPEICLFSDVALDPYTTHGHDGLIDNKGYVLNDESLEVLGQMAIVQAEAGVDFVAPSDMMDGRVQFIRSALDRAGFSDVGILSYCVKYASSFYGPFREALSSSLELGDKKNYQMNPANKREALREALIDVKEGADILMVKPALAYLDIISEIKKLVNLPISAYQVSGEFAMILAAHERGWLNGPEVLIETLISIKRAGADMIFTYGAKQAAEILLNEW